MILVFFRTTGIKSFICEPRLTTFQRWAWVQLGWRGHILQYLSSWCTAGSIIERQKVVRPAMQALHRVLFSLGTRWILNCVFFFFPVWFSHLHGKIFLVCLDFHCVDNIKGSGMGCGKRECAVWLSACFDVCLTAVVSGWCHYMCKVKGHPLSLQFTRKPANSIPRYNDMERFSSSISSYVHDKPAAC